MSSVRAHIHAKVPQWHSEPGRYLRWQSPGYAAMPGLNHPAMTAALPPVAGDVGWSLRPTGALPEAGPGRRTLSRDRRGSVSRGQNAGACTAVIRQPLAGRVWVNAGAARG